MLSEMLRRYGTAGRLTASGQRQVIALDDHFVTVLHTFQNGCKVSYGLWFIDV